MAIMALAEGVGENHNGKVAGMGGGHVRQQLQRLQRPLQQQHQQL